MAETRGEKPSFFKVLLADFVHHLRIPPQFLKHLGTTPPHKFVLWNSSSRCWDVHAQKVEKTLYFKGGWGDFVKDNGLETGDFLVFFYAGDSNFEVLQYGKNCCQKESSVVANNNMNLPSCDQNQNEGNPLQKRHQKIKGWEIMDIDSNDNSEDNASLGSSQGRRSLHWMSRRNKSSAYEAARKFVTKNISPPSCDKDHTEGYSGPMDQRHSSGYEAIDIVSENAGEDKTSLECLPGKSYLHQMSSLSKCSALEAADKFIRNYPSFKVSMSQSYLHHGFLHIPKDFWDKYIDKEQESITLRVSNKSWTVKLNALRHGLRLSGGWPAFAQDNSLQTGDVCFFELIDGVLHVTISRASA